MNKELQGQISTSLYRACISVIHTSYEEIQPSIYENQAVGKGR